VGAPAIRYALSGDASLAYMVEGEGPLDVVFLPGPITNVELLREHPRPAAMFERIASFSRLLLHDRRGMGQSDPWEGTPSIEEHAADLIAVMDAAGMERAAVVGAGEPGRLALYLAAAHPERVTAVAVQGITAAGEEMPAEPWRRRQEPDKAWGTGSSLDAFAPSLAGDSDFRAWWGRYERSAGSPGQIRAMAILARSIDIRDILPAVRAPTLFVHRTGDRIAPVEAARAAAALVPGSRFVELPGEDNIIFAGDWRPMIDEIEEFLTGTRRAPALDRVLATVLFTDIVGSTELAARLGDREWRDLLDRHDALVRHELTRFGGHEVKVLGDGFLTTFQSPGRAVECARAIAAAARDLGLEIRAGIHTGEVERRGEDVGGMAVHISARVMGLAGAGEVLTSSTVRDLVVGSQLGFEERGEHELKGAPGTWRVYAVV
jgi:class 3 adenylate cyclase